MTNPLITVIVPVFNAEPYLAKCIDSIRAQTYTNFELILVDDGSTDGSSRICDYYASLDDAVKIKCVHQQNGGVSSARNAGLELTRGDFVSFVDADDWVDEDFLSHLYSSIIRHGADISACGMLRHTSDDEIEASVAHHPVVLDRLGGVVGCIRQISLFANTCNRLYRWTLVRELRFSEQMTYGEDNLFNYHAYSRARRTVLDLTPKYHYIQRDDSATATRDRLGEDRLFMINEISDAIAGDPDWALIQPHVEARRVMDIVQLLINITKMPHPKEYRRQRLAHTAELRRLSREAVVNPVLSSKFKLAAILSVLHSGVLYAFLRLYSLTGASHATSGRTPMGGVG